ncbi:hypothetical protein [Kitasatospora sp. NPDC088783]|uniref:hypothetical protein n=1 Tax=Kitasatospora sp. NPDC088783 TaxID=3364077 RepID=UPI00380405DC
MNYLPFTGDLPDSAYEGDQLLRRLLRTHPGVVVDAQALISAAPAVSRVALPPLVRLLVHAHEADLPVLLRGAEHAKQVHALYRQRGLQQLWTDVLEGDRHRHTAHPPYVTAVLPDQVHEFLGPVPGLMATVHGRLIGPPQHPVPLAPHAQAMLVHLMAGHTYEEVADRAGRPTGLLRSLAARVTSPRGCRSIRHMIARDIVDGYLAPDAALATVTGEPAALTEDQRKPLIASIDQKLLSAADRHQGYGRTVAYEHRSEAVRALGARNPTHAVAVALAIGEIADDDVPARDPYPDGIKGPRRSTPASVRRPAAPTAPGTGPPAPRAAPEPDRRPPTRLAGTSTALFTEPVFTQPTAAGALVLPDRAID